MELHVRVDRRELEGLQAKYSEMLDMRLLHASGVEDAASVRERMAALAATYPGALREVDDLELDEIRRRIDALDAVLRREGEVEPWMEAVALFHAFARGALAAKRWLGGRKAVSEELVRRFVEDAGSLPFPEETRGWSDDLARVASPPGGRLTDLVFGRLAAVLGTSHDAARRLVFGVPRRVRHAH
jgi:hypothetical protein